MRSALEGIRVIDFTQIQFGPTCTQILADFGAEVIKVERVGIGEMYRRLDQYHNGQPVRMMALNRNKRCIAIDTKNEAGREIVYRLVRQADVVAQNFRPGVMERMGLGYDRLKQINPGIILANGSAFGQTGPCAHLVGQDGTGVAMSGLMYRNTRPPQPPTSMPTPLADFTAGQLMAQGILLALLARERTGVGQEVDVSLLDAALSILPQEVATLTITGEDHFGGGRGAKHPVSGIFRAKDSYLVMTGSFAPNPVRDVCAAMGLPDYSQDPRFSTPDKEQENGAELRAIVEARFLEKSRHDWLQILEAHEIICAPVLTLEEAICHPQVIHNRMIWEMEYEPLGKFKVLAPAMKLSNTPASLRMPPPRLGEHTDDVLREVGYCSDEIEQLRKQKVVG